ncbi:related to the plant PR-1 class of pathogen related proteins [Rhynchosporium graminicola]|uniref:Related to the plant PR-1 class of pathogen related proteins n=1 Tax=Rhynchosporium graminicola TaxID=2792576 RepID=A0A1E1LHF1_9HELO|nr:related to the plant PR-1 class of pathogen related proteins [Rhynchosporium commune]
MFPSSSSSSSSSLTSLALPLLPPLPRSKQTRPQNSLEQGFRSQRQNEHGVPDLSWNESSAELAGRWARGCRFVHSGGPTGENLAAGYPNATASVDAWGLERKDYDFKKPGFGEKTGHFTQLVWGNSTSVGCAVKACGGENDTPGYFVVCEYYPPGNVVGSKNQAFKDNVPAQEKGKKTDTVESGIGAKSGAVRNGLNAGGALVMGLMMAVGFGAWEL